MISVDWSVCSCWSCFNCNAFTRNIDLGIFRNLEHLIFTYFLCNPVSLLGWLKSHDLLSKVDCALDVQIIVMLRHSCIVNDKLESFVLVVRIFNFLGSWHLQFRHSFLRWRSFDFFLLLDRKLLMVSNINLGFRQLLRVHAWVMLAECFFSGNRLDNDRRWCLQNLLNLLIIWGSTYRVFILLNVVVG